MIAVLQRVDAKTGMGIVIQTLIVYLDYAETTIVMLRSFHLLKTMMIVANRQTVIFILRYYLIKAQEGRPKAF